MTFYQGVFGGELRINTFGDFNMPSEPSEAGLVLHSQLDAPNGMTLMGSDLPSDMDYTPGVNNFSVSLSGEDEAELRGYYDKLVDGGTVGMPMEKAPWGDIFGQCTDRFGVSWLVNVTPPA
jgi:PhnB protein